MVIACGGNVGESQAAKLGPHFSLMMLIDVPSEQVPNLRSQLQSMTDMNATVFEASTQKTKITPRIACTYVVCYSMGCGWILLLCSWLPSQIMRMCL